MPDHHLSEDRVTRSAEAFLRVGDYGSIWIGVTRKRPKVTDMGQPVFGRTIPPIDNRNLVPYKYGMQFRLGAD